MAKYRIIILIMLALISAPFLVRAQTADNVILSLSPQNPGPEENVTASVSTFAFDLERSKISWSVGGKLMSEGTGTKNFTFKTGKVGSRTTLTVSLTPPGGTKVSKSLVIQIAAADILFQSLNSYPPPFYRGRAMPSRESEILTLALPVGTIAGRTLKVGDFIYTWTKNGVLAGNSSSGFNKNSFVFTNRLIDATENIGVEMSELKNNLRISREIAIPLGNPEIIFYERDPLGGIIYNRAISGELKLTKAETTLVATPYFFSKNGEILKYSWFFNDELVPGQTGRELTIKKPDGIGQTKISVKVEKPKTLYQNADAAIIVKY